jgi:glycosyltransferase involved in cell wall biosynthesis
VFALHDSIPGSYVLGTSPDGGFVNSRSQGYCGIPAKLLPTARYWLRFVERNFDLVHIFHGIDCYHYLKAGGSKPVILTAISVDNILSMNHYAKIKTIVVESSRDRQRLVAHGFDPEKVVVIYPGTDLSFFSNKVSPPEGRFKVLFASSPFSPEYMEPRGVRLLLEAAKIMRDVEFVLLWRKRGNTLELLKRWISELGVTNVRVINEDLGDINRYYQESHTTIVPFTTEKNTKSCPNSAIECLASGRPVLASDLVGIADVIACEGCGMVFEPRVDKLVLALKNVIADYAKLQPNAKRCAQTYFSNEAFFETYSRLYRNIHLSN